MDQLVAAITLKALDGLSTRATVAAENIANGNTPGYQARRVNFEQALAAAAQRGVGAVETLKPSIGVDLTRQTLGSEGSRVDLDLADSAGAAGRYGALVDILNRQLQLSDLAIAGSR